MPVPGIPVVRILRTQAHWNARVTLPSARAKRAPRARLCSGAHTGKRQAGAYSCQTMSTEISTAGIAPLFSSQCMVFLSSGQPTPGP